MKFPTISLFSKITMVIVVFAILTYFMSDQLTKDQYSLQDTIIQTQELNLYLLMVSGWINNTNIDTTKIQNDLKNLSLRAFVAVFEDTNNNNTIDVVISDSLSHQDAVIWQWTNFPSEKFVHEEYLSFANLKDFYKILKEFESNYIDKHQNNYRASYGEYGPNNIPATHITLETNSNHLLGCWLVLDHILPADIDWPSRIVPLLILLMLLVLFSIIKKFLYPITVIINRIRKVKTGDLDSTIPILSNDELSELSQTTNNLIEEIKTLITQKHNLILDVSHELKSPLTRLRFLVENFPDSDDKEKMNREINFLKGMITNMLLSDKLSTPYVDNLTRSNITVNRLISEVLGMFHNVDKNINIVNKCDELIINVDKYKLMLAIRNLLDNALKYGTSKKKINLSVSHQKNNLQITVQDWGGGIPSSQLSKIKEPFYRGTSSRQTHKSGFGLGLAITQKIIKAHKGQLNIESELKKGSCFTILLPLKGV